MKKYSSHFYSEVKKYLGSPWMSEGRLLHLDNFRGQFCPSSSANDTFLLTISTYLHIFSLYQTGLDPSVNTCTSSCSHSHTSSLTLSHIYTRMNHNHNRDMIAPCKQNIPTTLCCLVRSDTIPPYKRNRKPGRKGFTKQFCGPLYKLATFVHLTHKNIRLYTPNINH